MFGQIIAVLISSLVPVLIQRLVDKGKITASEALEIGTASQQLMEQLSLLSPEDQVTIGVDAVTLAKTKLESLAVAAKATQGIHDDFKKFLEDLKSKQDGD